MTYFAEITDERIKREEGRLTSLELYQCESILDLRKLEGAKDIELLTLGHFPKMSSLEGIDALSNLKELHLSTAVGWDGSNRVLEVETFEPLVALEKLEVLVLLGVVPKKDRVEPLCRIKSLRKLTASASFYQMDDIAALSRALPGVKMRPADDEGTGSSLCPRCGAARLGLYASKPRAPRYLCPSCGKKKLAAHLEAWNAAGGLPRYPDVSGMDTAQILSVLKRLAGRQ